MTRPNLHEIECPKCGAKQTETVWESINATINPDLKEKLIQGQINVFHCQKCREEAFVSIPLLYHDMTRKFCVQFYPFEWLRYDRCLEDFTWDADLNIPFPMPKYTDFMKRTHIVFDMNELVRYVIFRDKLSEGNMEKRHQLLHGQKDSDVEQVFSQDAGEQNTDPRTQAARLIMDGVDLLTQATNFDPSLQSIVQQALDILKKGVERLAREGGS